jgi:CRP/FNR family transcriptional regulator, cyclic AMP receptor protein
VFRKDLKIERLSRVALFSECSKRELAEIAAIADEISVPAGSTLIQQGATGREFIVVLDGDVELRRDGRRIALKGDDNAFGEAALLNGKPRNATLTAKTDVDALIITDRAFHRLMKDAPSIQWKLLASLAARVAADD